jgi:WD40 repeat protein
LERRTERPPQKAIRDLAFYRAAAHEWLAVASDNNFATKLTLDLDEQRVVASGQANKPGFDHDRPVVLARFISREDHSVSLMTVSDKQVWFWEDEGKQRQIRRHGNWIRGAEPSPNGEYVVSVSDDGTARVWSTRARALVGELRGHHDAVTSAIFGRDETEVITGSRDGTVQVWRLQPPQVLWSKRNRWALSAALSPDGTRVAVCGESPGTTANAHACDLVAVQASAPIRSLPLVDVERFGATTVSRISWSHDSRFLIGHAFANGIDRDQHIVVWTAAQGQDVTPLWLNDWASAAVAETTGELVTLDRHGALSVWPASALEAAEQPQPPRLTRPAQAGRSLAAISPDGRWLATVNAQRNDVTLIDRQAKEGSDVVLGAHGGEIKSARFSNDGERLVTASNDRTARVWSVQQRKEPVDLAGGHRANLYFASFSPDARLVATSSADNTVRVWDAQSGKELVALEWHREGVNEVHFSADGKSLLTASDDGSVKLGACSACVADIGELVGRIASLARVPGDEFDARMQKLREESPWYQRWLEPLLAR